MRTVLPWLFEKMGEIDTQTPPFVSTVFFIVLIVVLAAVCAQTCGVFMEDEEDDD